MARPRSPINRKLPPGLRVRRGYFSYFCPIKRREYGLGYDRESAIAQVIEVQGWAARERARMKLRKIIDEPAQDDLNLEQILAGSIPVPSGCGVYFLIGNDTVVYVGSSIDCFRRIAAHRAEGIKIFDSWYFVKTTPDERTTVEMKYIEKFRPIYNISGNPNWRSSGEVLETYIAK